MDRWQEIVNRSVEEEYKDMFGFQAGADWADNHPSEETIKKIAIMANQGECQAAPLEKIVEYIKQHWNDDKD